MYEIVFLTCLTIVFMVSRSFLLGIFSGCFGVLVCSMLMYKLPKSPKSPESPKRVTMNVVTAVVSALVTSFTLMLLNNTALLHMLVYACIVYFIVSLMEWFIHKYVMHCYQNWTWLQRHRDTLPALCDFCESHKHHHETVKQDMSLRTDAKIEELIFDWKNSLILFVIAWVLVFIAMKTLRLKVTLIIHTFVIALLALIFAFTWNTIHPSIHKFVTNDSIWHAPIFNVHWRPSLFTDNHAAHHHVKGHTKGNFNVVFIGADEWMGTNRM